MRPFVRDFFFRKNSDVTNSAVLPRFRSPWINPRRRAGGSTSHQSVIPFAAAPAAPTTPIAIDMSADTANSDRSSTKSRTSKTIATVHAPVGTSLSITCNGSPNQVPFKKFLICCATGCPPAYRVLSSTFCNLSSIRAGRDEPRLISTSFPRFLSVSEFSRVSSLSIHHIAAIATLISQVPNTLAPRAGRVQGDLLRGSSANARNSQAHRDGRWRCACRSFQIALFSVTVFSALVHCGMATKLRGSGEDAPPLCSPIPSRVLAAYPSHGAAL